jgi:hypothetical protein
MKENTVGYWLPKLEANIRVKPFWTVVRDRRGTHAVIDACVLLKKGETVIGLVRMGVVARGADYPADTDWKAGSMPVLEATRLVTEVAKRDYSWLDARAFAGVNCALPWEVPQPKPPAWWRRIGRWLCFWRKQG